MRSMPTPKIPVQRVTVTLTMDCREDLPEPWLEWMRDALEAYARNVFESGGPPGRTGGPRRRHARSVGTGSHHCSSR